MNLTEAQQAASAYLADDNLVILEESTIEKEFGWVFFYQSREFIETGDILNALAGNAPLIVEKSGHVHVTGTALPLEEYLTEFENKASK